jgi:glutamate dehydrogenase
MSKNLAQKSSNNNNKQFVDLFFSNPDEKPSKEEMKKADDAFAFLQNRANGKPKIEITDSQDTTKLRSVLKVLNDDKTFLVDSVIAEVTRHNYKILDIHHPILRVNRDASGKFTSLSESGNAESLIYLEISYLTKEQRKELSTALEKVLKAVYAAIEDWRKMLTQVETATANLKAGAKFKKDQVSEALDFLKWLGDNHFTFLGFAEYDVISGTNKLKQKAGSALGVMRNSLENSNALTLELNTTNLEEILEITKSGSKAIVHRSVYMDLIAVKKIDTSGKTVGEYRFLGLFASSAYYQSTNQIPVIRRKAECVQNKSGFTRGGHSAKIAQFILDSYPRDEIFQSTTDHLLDNILSILELMEKPNVGFYIRRDRYDRFYSCLIYVPKDKFDTALRKKIQAILEKALGGKVTEYYTQITDSPLSRLHLLIQPIYGIAKYDIDDLRSKIAEATNQWGDELESALNSHFGERRGEELLHRYEGAFPKDYVATHSGKNAAFDIENVEAAITSQKIEVEFYEDENRLHLKSFNPGAPMPLSDTLPILENLGLRVIAEKPYQVKLNSYPNGIRIRDFQVEPTNGKKINLEEVKDNFEVALQKVVSGEIENDPLNKLVIYAKMNWRDVALVRAYTRYMRQAGLKLGLPFFMEALTSQAKLSSLLVELFHEYFDPKLKKRAPEKVLAAIDAELANVTNLNEDRVIRRTLETINATIRTNFFLNKSYISFKFDSKKAPDLPLPRPLFEVFVYSPEVEGIHLRGGTVARGGLRWSDRHEDFRTEVLGLMKAQMVKNSVIVPVGSKGGFVVKGNVPEDRDAKLKQGIECYKTFLRGILDVTDNILNGKIVAPKDVVRRDCDDPYLVVAADKGTATFSDIANGVSKEYGFWLDDAFASGGSVGYDHKKMGITAKGGWISVERHFREMGIDTQSQDFTCVGIGDMAGDVFGNGMLLSKHIRLVAAFNHMHIFLDPTPDSAKSFKERDRLFNLPRSSWEDYDKKLISKGGGIFKRSEKTIKLTAEVKQALDIKENELSPDELIRAILKSPVDLLWNGGIGTYVKSEGETHITVGDKNNDSLRVNGAELRCKVMGEGGNLGFTQLGRIEYAKKGGRINTDAIDNSAGVDCSDHEVNIKIALAAAIEKKKLTLAARDKLLEKMTDEVGALVLRDNYLQTQALSVSEMQGVTRVEAQASLIRHLEQTGLLDRTIEFLPTDEEIGRRIAARQGLTRPELAVLLAYSKIWIYNDLLASKLPDEAYFKNDLMRYFPAEMQSKFKAEIEGHKLNREIIATFVTNSIVNREGSTFFHKIIKDTGMHAADVARCYTVVRDAFKLRDLWKEIESLDGKVDPKVQYEMLMNISKFIERLTLWFLRNLPQPINVEKAINDYAKDIETFRSKLGSMLNETLSLDVQISTSSLTSQKVPQVLAEKIASLDVVASACDIAVVTRTGKLPLNTVGKIYFQLGEKLNLNWLRSAASNLPTDTYWQKLAVSNLVDSLYDHQRKIAKEIVKSGKANALDDWLKANSAQIERHEKFMQELRASGQFDLAMLISAVRRVDSL